MGYSYASSTITVFDNLFIWFPEFFDISEVNIWYMEVPWHDSHDTPILPGLAFAIAALASSFFIRTAN